MKFAIKAMVGAVVLAAAGQASAFNAAAGDLTLVAWDGTTEYVRDLGSYSNFLASDTTAQTFAENSTTDPTSLWASVGLNTSSLSWIVYGGSSTNFVFADGSTGGLTPTTNNSQVTAAEGYINSYLTSLNSDTNCGGATALACILPSSDSHYAQTYWGAKIHGAIVNNYSNPSAFNVAYGAFEAAKGSGGATSPGVVTALANGNGAFTLLADGDVDYTVSSTPIPAAVWLMGSGLVGLLGIGRRRKTA